MDTCKLTFSACATGQDLYLTVRFDGSVIYQGYPGTQAQQIHHDFADADDAEHELLIEMSGKLPHHTKIDQDGSILSDQVLEISGVALDGIELGQVFYQQASYHHDFNGTQPEIQDQFFGTMGCNGTVRLRFTSPSYLWLLESM